MPRSVREIDLRADESPIAQQALDTMLAEVEYKSWPNTPNDEQRAKHKKKFDPDRDICYVLVDDEPERLLAAGQVFDIPGKVPHTWVSILAVPSSEQRKGYGKELLGRIALEAKARGSMRIELSALAPGYFARLGFAAVGNSQLRMSASVDQVIARCNVATTQ